MSAKKKLIRSAFREAVLLRDGNRCRICKRDEGALDAHHITDRDVMPNGGYVTENGISLCGECHLAAERAEKSDKTFGPDTLYMLIGSDLNRAYEASKKLLL